MSQEGAAKHTQWRMSVPFALELTGMLSALIRIGSGLGKMYLQPIQVEKAGTEMVIAAI